MADQDKKSKAKDSKKNKKKKKEETVSFHRKPEKMSVEQWQIELRRQFVAENSFVIEKISNETVFADYTVNNPETKKTYKVALRSADASANYCDCYDFKVNHLGTCKHIEAVFHHVRKKRLRKYLKEPVQRDYSSVFVDYKDGRAVKIRIGDTQCADFQKIAAATFDKTGKLTEKGLSNFDTFLKKAKKLDEQFRCYEDALDIILEKRENQRRYQQYLSLSATDQSAFLKDLVKTDMFDYQKEGVLYAFKNGRVIIGDEMGLGKTIQAIAGAELLLRQCGISRVLILAPTSLKYQWKTEIAKFTGTEAHVIEGNALVRARTHRENNTFYKIAGYHSALYDWEAMADAEYDLIILDEAQRLKNWRTKIAQSVRKIPTRYAFVLSGTPIENNLEELYGITQLVDPFALGPRHTFFPRYQTTDENNRVVGYENLSEIRELLKDRLIRRTKKQVLKQLPARRDKNLLVPMTKQQSEMHREFADQVARLVLKWQRQHFLDEQDRQKLLKNLNMMRMVCDSTYIVDQATNYQTKIDELRNILEEILEMEGEKVVIFSQWARMNHLVSQTLDEMGVEYRYLHGDVPGKNRGQLYEDFTNKPEVRVFLSTDAGGVGLNLQAAAWLINLDIPWNPGILEQRIGRIYRLGQEKPVNIINLVAHGTIENNLLGILQFKKSMAAGVLDDGEDSIFLGDSKFRKFMESVEVITRDVAPQSVDEVEPSIQSDNEPEEFRPDAAAPVAEPVPVFAETQAEPNEDTEEAVPQSPPAPASPARVQEGTPQALVQNGIQFFSQLAQTLSNPEATERLVKTIVQKDEKTGQTYVKLPVENEAMVQGVLNLLGGLFKAMS